MPVNRVKSRNRPVAVLLTKGGAAGNGARLAKCLAQMRFRTIVIAEAFPAREARWISHWQSIDYTNYPDMVIKACKQYKPLVVCSDQRNASLPVKAAVLEALGMPRPGRVAAILSNDKIELRKTLSASPVPCVPWYSLDDVDAGNLKYPVVIKPKSGTGSTGVRKVHSVDEMVALLRQAPYVDGRDGFLVERFISGRQFDLEGVCSNGVPHILTIVEESYRDTGQGFPAGWYLFNPPLDSVTKDKLEEATRSVLSACQVESGAFHCEFRLDDDGTPYLIDYANRYGYPHLVSAASGTDFIGLYARTMLNEPIGPVQGAERSLYCEYIPSWRRRTKLLPLLCRHPSLVVEAKLLGSVTAGVRNYGRWGISTPSFSTTEKVLARYGLLPDNWNDLYHKHD